MSYNNEYMKATRLGLYPVADIVTACVENVAVPTAVLVIAMQNIGVHY
jgi:hypothetical protein